MQGLQGLVAPCDMVDLLDLYEFCGHQLDALKQLGHKLTEHKGELQADCKALRMVLAAAKQLHNKEVSKEREGREGGGPSWPGSCVAVPRKHPFGAWSAFCAVVLSPRELSP